MTAQFAELQLRIVGVLLLMIAALSVYIPRRFGWAGEIQRLTLLTRQVFVVHAVFVSLVVSMLGVLLAFFAPAMLAPGTLPKVILVGLLVMWAARMLAQWFYYDASLWRGHGLNTVMHVVFSLIYVYFVAAFVLALIVQARV